MPRLPHGLLLLLLFGPVVEAKEHALWRFHVRIDAGAERLVVAACSDRGLDRVRFVRGGTRAPDAREYLQRSGTGAWDARGEARDWQRGECLVTNLPARAVASGRVRFDPAAWLLDPGLWLWRPEALDPESTIRFELPAGWAASVPWTPLRDEAHTYRLGPTAADWPALTAFGAFSEQARDYPGGTLRIAIVSPWSAREIARIEPVAQALLQAYGTLPRRDTQVLVVPLRGQQEAAPWGQVLRGGGAAVHLFVGADAAPDALIRDWTATHEFAHLLHPYLGGRGRWLAEGLASYYQNVLRARAGTIDAEDAWARIEAGFARGERDANAAGLSLEEASRRAGALRAFMRVYWSGAAYWLETDLELRARGSSLDQVLERYAECCLAQAIDADIEQFLHALDRAAGAEIFFARQRRYAQLTAFPDLAPLRLRLREHALRIAIMQPRAAIAVAPQPN